MVRLVILVTLAAVVLAPQATAAPAYLSLPDARFNINRLVRQLPVPDGFRRADWNVTRCFRLGPNKVQCRWSTVYVGDLGRIRRYGNAVSNGRFSRVVSSDCVPASRST